MTRQEFANAMEAVKRDVQAGDPRYIVTLAERGARLLEPRQATDDEQALIGFAPGLLWPYTLDAPTEQVVSTFALVFSLAYQLGRADAAEEATFGEELARGGLAKPEDEGGPQ